MIIAYFLFGLLALVGLAVVIFIVKTVGGVILSLLGYVFSNIGGCCLYVFLGFMMLFLLALLI